MMPGMQLVAAGGAHPKRGSIAHAVPLHVYKPRKLSLPCIIYSLQIPAVLIALTDNVHVGGRLPFSIGLQWRCPC